MSKREKRRYVNARERAEKEKQGFTASILKLPEGVELFRPKAGRYLIDILPFQKEDGTLDYERRFYTHRHVGANEQTFICPAKTFRKPCPICEAQAKLVRRGADEDLIKSLAAKERQLFNIMDLKNPDKGVQLFECSYHVFGKKLTEAVLSADEDENWDMFFTLEEGLTLKVMFADQSGGGYSFVGTERIDFRERRQQYDEDILEKVTNLDDILIEPDYDELKETFLETESEEEDEEDSEEDESPKSRNGKSSKGSSEKKRSSDQDDEDEEDETPKSRKSKHVDEDEDEEEHQHKKKAPKAEDDDWDEFEDKPKKKSKHVDEDEDEEETKPKSKKSEDEDEEDEEEAPKSKKKSKDDEEDDWEDVPKSKKKSSDEDEDEEEDEKPKSRKSRDEDEEEDEEDAGKKKGGLFPRGKAKVKAGADEDEED